MLNLLYEGFANFLILKDSRQITVDRHIRSLKLLAKSLNSLNYNDVKQYLDNKKISGISGSSLNAVVTTLRLYGKFTGLDELIKLPLYPRKQKEIRRTLSDAQIEAFLAVPQRKWQSVSSWKKWQCFWYLLAFTGIRLQEVKKLIKSDMDMANSQIILRPEVSKTSQFSTIPLFPNMIETVQAYLDEIPEGLLFRSEKGSENGMLCQSGWSEEFNYRLKYAGIKKVAGLVPTSLRHSCATRWIANDMSLFKVRRLMRHVKMDQTLTYEHMTSQHLINAVLKYDPLVRKHADLKEILKAFNDYIESFGIIEDGRFSEKFRKGIKDLIFAESERLGRSIAVFFVTLAWVAWVL